MAEYTDALFNSKNRHLGIKAIIYFDELNPTTVTKDDALVDYSITESMWEDSSSVFGSISANTLDLTLNNQDRRFTPSNAAGEFYGKIKTGIRIDMFLKLINSDDSLPWLPMGTFYVTDWQADRVGVEASVYAADKLQKVFGGDTTTIQVVPDYTYAQFLAYYFTQLGYTATIDSLTTVLPFGWSAATSQDDLTLHVQAALACCYCDRENDILVKALMVSRSLKATLTDADQVVTVTTKQSVKQSYNGVKLTYYVPVKTADTKVLESSEISVAAGTNVLDTMTFEDGPVYAVESVACQSEDAVVYVSSLDYAPWQITLSLVSDIAAVTNILVYGTVVTMTGTIIDDDSDNELSYDNSFIQDATYAATFKQIFDAYVASELPTIEVEIRGNLLLKLGDKIRIQSDYYAIDFTGIIFREVISGDGGLGTTLSLIDASIFTPTV